MSTRNGCRTSSGMYQRRAAVREGVGPPRGRGRLSGVRETQLFLRSSRSTGVNDTGIIICGHKLQWGQDILRYFYFSDLC